MSELTDLCLTEEEEEIINEEEYNRVVDEEEEDDDVWGEIDQAIENDDEVEGESDTGISAKDWSLGSNFDPSKKCPHGQRYYTKPQRCLCPYAMSLKRLQLPQGYTRLGCACNNEDHGWDREEQQCVACTGGRTLKDRRCKCPKLSTFSLDKQRCLCYDGRDLNAATGQCNRIRCPSNSYKDPKTSLCLLKRRT